jgi:hypothetical protein
MAIDDDDNGVLWEGEERGQPMLLVAAASTMVKSSWVPPLCAFWMCFVVVVAFSFSETSSVVWCGVCGCPKLVLTLIPYPSVEKKCSKFRRLPHSTLATLQLFNHKVASSHFRIFCTITWSVPKTFELSLFDRPC